MTKIADKLRNLSPEKRALFERLMAEEKAKKEAALEASKLDIPNFPSEPEKRYEPFPLTDIQQAQWFGRSGLFELTSAAHVYVEFDSEGLDLDRLEEVWNEIVKENDQLRMKVLGDLRQVVLEEVPYYEFKRIDLTGKSEKEVEESLAETRADMGHQILPADQFPIWEVRASVIDGGRLRLHVSFDLIVGDAWSFRVLMDHWAQRYHHGDEAKREPVDYSFRDYVHALEALEETEVFQRDLAYWKEQLAVLPNPPELPMAKQPSELDEHRSLHFTDTVAANVWSELKGRIKDHRLTASNFFLAAWSEVVTVWTKSPEFALNVTVFNRLPVHEDVNAVLVGEFNSFCLFGVDNSGKRPFHERALEKQEKLWRHIDHRTVSGVRQMRELAHIRGTQSGGALMPAVFTSTLAHHDSEGWSPSVFPGEWVYEVSQTPQVWMEHHIWEDEGKLVLHVDVVDGVFPEGMFAEVFAAYVQLLHELARDPEAWNRTDARHLVPAEQLQLRAEVNNTAAAISDELMHGLMRKQAAERGDTTAVISARGNLTYAELDSRSNRVGRFLREAGAEPNELVAVVMEKGWEQAVAAYGIQKSGAAYLPIEPDVPTDRLHHLLSVGECKLALTQSELVAELSWPEGVQVFAVDGDAFDGVSDEALEDVQGPDDIAYVIFTSGSTGTPKGVVISHRGAVNTILDINERFQVDAEDRGLALAAMGFDLSVYDLFGTLAAGGSVVIPSKQDPDPSEWVQLIAEHGVTLWNSVPALMEMLVTHAEGTKTELPSSLRLALLSGDWIPVSLPGRLSAVREGIEVISLGGATEASIWSILHPIVAVDPEWKSIPYGKPMKNQTFHVLNGDLKPCPTWTTGDLYIGGVGVALGYWRDDEKTAASFLEHPETGERLYRTGDLGRYLPNGEIEFLGREDNQVKVRGFRIELGEIEENLNKVDGIAASVVAALGASDNRRLVAYVVPADGTELDTEAVQKALGAKLPEYMLPQSYVAMEALPLTANGKVDRKNLPAPEDVGKENVYVAPRNEAEEKLAQLWQEVLDVEKVGVYDDFFELGGNSLLANQLLFRVHDAFGIELPLSKLFEATTIDKVAVLLEETLIAQMEGMSEEEIQRLLEEEAVGV